jgi:regulator of sigma E protease
MAGEQASDDHLDDPRSFMAKPRWQRLIIAAAGPFMNVVLAIAVLTGLFMVKYQKIADSDLEAVVGHVIPDSAAAKAGIQAGDRIVQLDGRQHPTWDDVGMREVTSANRPMALTVERDGKRFPITVTPAFNERIGVGFAGWDEKAQIQLLEITPNYPAEKAGLKTGDLLVAVNGQPIHSAIRFQEITKGSAGKPLDIEFERAGERHHVTVQPVYSNLDGAERWMIGVKPQQKFTIVTTKLSFRDALNESLSQNKKYAMLIVQVLKGIVERRVSPKNLSGPIGIAQQAGDAARHGAAEFFMLMALVSLNLAIFNLLPIPILDGGVILMLLVEMVMQRDLSLNVKEAVFKVGFVCIMVIVAFVLYNDIAKILPGGG